MPTYQYACTEPACGNRFEQVQSFTDPSLTECPVCSGRVRKVFGSVGVVFKGSGFYRNDSRTGGTDGGSNGAKSDSKSETKSETKSDSKSDAKSDAKSETKSDSAKKSQNKPAVASTGSSTAKSA